VSTELQQYSNEHQALAIERYAEEHSLTIIERFEDYGKSGLGIAGRPALLSLLRDVESGSATFGHILVYDVTRWGRFQDVDESAYYEYLCKRARVRVHYCAEPFLNDGSITSALLKAIKRSMAAEYSRELSLRVFAGQSRLVELGFSQGGSPGYGLRRQLQDRYGNVKGALLPGEQKSIQTDRVVLVPGPDKERAVIRTIFKVSNTTGSNPTAIARLLNSRGLVTSRGSKWTRKSVRNVLINEKYAGTNIYNRVSTKFKGKSVSNPLPCGYAALVHTKQSFRLQN
jgi:DNA invertase Pin-like site-specific DNA recombinase